MPEKLLFASNNAGKISEIRFILDHLPFQLVTPADLSLNLTVKEDGATYFENALLKAQAFFDATGLITLADDSGLEVAVLNGAPGIQSNRYAPILNATDGDRRSYLLKQLASQPRPWHATFQCEIVIIDQAGQVNRSHGSCAGEIIPEERGTGGFGYDPIFYIPEWHATMAELGEGVKNRISHRANALKAAMPALMQIFECG